MSTPDDIDVDGLEAEEPAESLSPVARDERSFGRYLLQYEIASGGMASIYLARAQGAAGFERPIAIKRIHPHLARKPAFVDMFLDEARLNARITHPNVCNVLDFGEAEGTYFMAMEYLVGQPLSRVLGAVSLRPDLATSRRWHALSARILADACQGLNAAHDLVDERGAPMNVVHRDFTPHNVFVTYDGAVKVFDFGVARAEGRLHHTDTGLLKGKLAYMSPEQLSRAPIDRRLDVWAAGVCLWELLTLRRLFGKRSELEIVQAIGSEPILKPSQVRTGVPPELDAITLRALERDPARRTPTARALARELNQFVSTTGVSTALEDIAELMAELFAEERDRKLDVVATVLRSEDALPLDMNDTSSVQRSRLVQTSPARPVRSPNGSVLPPPTTPPASVRPPSIRPPSIRPTSIRPPSTTAPPAQPTPSAESGPKQTSQTSPPPAARASPGSGETGPKARVVLDDNVQEEQTTRQAVDLADMLEPPSETSLSLQLGANALAAAGAVESSVIVSDPTSSLDDELGQTARSRRTLYLAGVVLALLGITVFAIVASGVLDGEAPTADPPAGLSTPPRPATPPGTTPSSPQHAPSAVPVGDPEPVSGEGQTGASMDPPSSPPATPSEEEGAEHAPGAAVAPSQDAPQEMSEAPPLPEERRDDRPAPRRGSLNVAARGGWADLYVDGQHVGRTPRSIQLSAGRHVVELRRDSESLARRAVTIRPGRAERIVIDL